MPSIDPIGPDEIHVNLTEAEVDEIMQYGEQINKLRNATTTTEHTAAIAEILGTSPNDTEVQMVQSMFDDLNNFDFTQE